MKALDFCKAKSLETGEWVYGYYVKHIYSDTTQKPRERGYIGYIGDDGYSFIEVDPSTKRRYVGKDENGESLYERDVVEIYRYEHGERKSCEINPIYFEDYGYRPMTRFDNYYQTNKYCVRLVEREK